MFTLADAEALGWTLLSDGAAGGVGFRGTANDRAAAYARLSEAQTDLAAMTAAEIRADPARWRALLGAVDAAQAAVEALREIHVASSIPIFALLANIAEAEGHGFVAGYGGEQSVTSGLVLAVSGEVYEPAAPASPSAEVIAAAAEKLRAIRDEWLNQAQPVFTEIASPGVQDLSPAMLAGIAAHADAWVEWRQAMRDLPALLDLDFVAAAAAGADLVSTSDAWLAPWPNPPAAPVIRRRKEG